MDSKPRDHQPGAQEIILFVGAGMGLHRRSEFAGFMGPDYETLQDNANETSA